MAQSPKLPNKALHFPSYLKLPFSTRIWVWHALQHAYGIRTRKHVQLLIWTCPAAKFEHRLQLLCSRITWVVHRLCSSFDMYFPPRSSALVDWPTVAGCSPVQGIDPIFSPGGCEVLRKYKVCTRHANDTQTYVLYTVWYSLNSFQHICTTACAFVAFLQSAGSATKVPNSWKE